MKKIEKGYMLEIVSWENDGDNYRTKYLHEDTLEGAKELKKFLEDLFGSKNAHGEGVGNSGDWELDETEAKIYTYLENNSESLICQKALEELGRKDVDSGIEQWDIIESVSSIAYDAMGGSEFYLFRVVESVKVYYVPQTITLEEVL